MDTDSGNYQYGKTTFQRNVLWEKIFYALLRIITLPLRRFFYNLFHFYYRKYEPAAQKLL